MAKPVAFEIIVGTYEQFLLGYKFHDETSELKQSFAIRSHTGSIKCVHTLGRFLASGGTDDRIFVYDLLTRKEHCMLTQHNATVNCIQFTPDRTHVLSGCADGTLAIVRVGNWQLEKLWENAHKGAIYNIDIHPSGKLALTLGADSSLKTWNLVKGRQAYVINLNSKSSDPKSLEHIAWAPNAEKFTLCGGIYTEIWSIGKGGILKSIKHSSKVTSCAWLKNETLLAGYENGKVAVINTKTEKVDVKECHNGRVKSIGIFSDYIVTASSNGEIKVWDEEFQEIAKCNTGCRITCLNIASATAIKQEETETFTEIVQTKRSAVEDNLEESEEISEETNEEIEVSRPKKKKNRQKKRKKNVAVITENVYKKK